jgi:predicted acyl esterase
VASGLDGAALALWRDVPLTLGDGIVLRADIWRPTGADRVPAILVRTPYGKEDAVPSGILDPATAVSAGFAVVIQDVRGTGTSGGSFEPYVNEARDGHDTIEWVGAQRWCDGRVVMSGMSYVGVVQWLAASRRPPALAALAPAITSDELGEGWSFRGGVLESGFLRTWIANALAPPALRILDGLDEVAEGSDGLGAIAPWSAPWFSEPAASAYWKALGPAPGSVPDDIPALVIAGWYDCFVGGSLRSFARRHGTRDRLIVGPWGHESSLTHLIGERALGSSGSADEFGLRARILAFYRAVLDGEEPPAPRVFAYVLRAGRWLELESWPPTGARSLTVDVSGSGSFQADPGALPRALGGRRLQGGTPGSGMGPWDQRPLLADGRALRLDAEPFTDALVAAGPAGATLTISATGDGLRQWVVILCVEEAEGALVNLAEGIVEAPAATAEVAVQLGDICVDLKRGERLVLVVAGGLARRFPAPASAAEQRVDGASLVLTVAS